MERTNQNETICYNPATNLEIGRSRLTEVSELKEIVKNASEAQKEWAKLSVTERIKIVKKLENIL